jgi:Xaa-Pro dipeptidase
VSKHDFPRHEFDDRLARTRRAIAAAGLDWMLLFHPVSIHWLIGSDAKSYQTFQCLPVSAEPRPLVMFTRESERNEYSDDTLADEVRSWGGPEPDDPITAFGHVLDDLGVRRGRVGIEVPAY